MERKVKMKSGVVWVESARGNWNPLSFTISGDGITKKELEEYIREKMPSCLSIIFSKPGRKK